MNKILVKIWIGIKSIIILLFIISAFSILQEQFVLQNSEFPENKEILERRTYSPWDMLYFTLPLIISIFSDIKELKNHYLKRKWIHLQLALIIGYITVDVINEKWLFYLISILLIAIFSKTIVVFPKNKNGLK